MEWYTGVLRKYAVFEGRASRKEFWMFTLINVGIAFLIGFVEGLLGLPQFISGLYMLAIFIPSLAVVVRRLHDMDKSGWWALLGLIPFVGSVILLIMCAFKGTPGPNRFGSSIAGVPVAPAAAADTSVHQSEPEIKETMQNAEDVVINDVPSSEPIPSMTEADTVGSADSSNPSSN